MLATLSVADPVAAGPIVGEWEPGLTEAEVGGPLVVDGYGVNGLGLYQVQLADGTTRAAVCVQADVGHSLAADYVVEPSSSFAPALGYLLRAYVEGGSPTEVEAAAINVLAWRYTDARRRTGGPVWQGDDVEVRALGVGRLAEVEDAVRRLDAEATARRGPWAFTELVVADGSAAIGVGGPGGPIAGVPVTFDTGGWSAVAVTGPDGRAVAVGPGGRPGDRGHRRGPRWGRRPRRAGLAAPGHGRPTGRPPRDGARPAGDDDDQHDHDAAACDDRHHRAAVDDDRAVVEHDDDVAAGDDLDHHVVDHHVDDDDVAAGDDLDHHADDHHADDHHADDHHADDQATTDALTGPPTLPRTGGSSRGVVRIGSVLFAAGAVAVLIARRGTDPAQIAGLSGRRRAGGAPRRRSSPRSRRTRRRRR